MLQLSDQQLNFFNLFGYLKLEGLFVDEISEITAAFDATFRDYADDIVQWDHVVHHNLPRQIMPQIADKSAVIREHLNHPQLQAIMNRVLGEGYKFIGSDANIYDCGTRWHTDIIGLPYNCKNAKAIYYLDPSHVNADCFRLIPGSHFHTDAFAKQLKKQIREPEQSLNLKVEGIPCQQIPTEPGDLILFDARVWHSVGYAGNTRRAISFLFGDKNYQPPEQGNTHPVQNYDE